MYGWGLGGTCNPSNPVPSSQWNEITSNNPGGDRRGLGSTGSFTMLQGSVHTLDIAYVFGRDYTSGGPHKSLMIVDSVRVDSIRKYFQQDSTPCGGFFRTDVPSTRPQINSISIYPNPTSDILFISLSGKTKNAVAEIYDITGKKVLSMNMFSLSEGKIDVSSLSNGLYIIRIIDGEKFFNKKFVKQ